jgi:positive regulator of sigma E activity
MSAGGSAAGSGLVVGLCLVFLGQQFGFFDLSSLVTGVIYLVAFAIVFAVVFGLVGMWLGARYLRKHASLTPWKPKTAQPATSSSQTTPDADSK